MICMFLHVNVTWTCTKLGQLFVLEMTAIAGLWYFTTAITAITVDSKFLLQTAIYISSLISIIHHDVYSMLGLSTPKTRLDQIDLRIW
jgi:hypothetical protein